MHFLSAGVGEQLWKPLVSPTLPSYGWFQRQVFTAAWTKRQAAICHLLFSWSIGIWGAYIGLPLSVQSRAHHQPAGFVLVCPHLTRGTSPRIQSWQPHPFCLLLLMGPEGCVVKVRSSCSLQIPVSYVDSSDSPALWSLGSRIASLFHSSTCWIQKTTCNYFCCKSKHVWNVLFCLDPLLSTIASHLHNFPYFPPKTPPGPCKHTCERRKESALRSAGTAFTGWDANNHQTTLETFICLREKCLPSASRRAHSWSEFARSSFSTGCCHLPLPPPFSVSSLPGRRQP